MWGDKVNVASRMESHGVEGRLQISEATWSLVLGRVEVEDRGRIETKSKGLMRTFIVVRVLPDPADPAPEPAAAGATDSASPAARTATLSR